MLVSRSLHSADEAGDDTDLKYLGLQILTFFTILGAGRRPPPPARRAVSKKEVVRARSRTLATALLAATTVLGFAGAASASHYKYLGSLDLRISGGQGRFTGQHEFYAQGTGHGGYHVWGSVCDTAEDGNGVYSQGRVEGYGWSSKVSDGNGSQSGCGSENREFYDPQATWVNRGQYRVCVDDLGTDTCEVSQWYYRH